MKTKVVTLAFTAIFLSLFLTVFPKTGLGFPAQQPNSQAETLQKVVSSLENQFDVSITIDVQASETVKVESSEKIINSPSIEKALDLLVKGTDLKYRKLRSDYYVISASPVKNATPAVDDTIKQKQHQGRVISGMVTFQSDNTPITGATVLVKGTTNGTITDLDGHYQITVGDNDKVLEFSFMGMRTETVKIGNKSKIDVSMKEDAFGLDEVIVAGVAANTPKKNLTISVTKVGDDKLNSGPAPSTVQALQGKVAGVTVVQAGGLPGSGAAIRLRGSTSLLGNQAPMIVLDGIITNTNLADINVNDIESLEVVKGAAAAALYGSRAGNGVIVITTKRGKNTDNKTSFTFRTEYGIQQIPHYIQQATHHPYKLADDWEEHTDYTKYKGVLYDSLGNILIGNRKVTDSAWADQPYARLIDHQKKFFHNGVYTNNYLSAAGSKKGVNFLISYERNRQQGIVFSTGGYTRNNLRVNLDYHLSPKLKLSTSNLMIFTKSNNPGSYKSFNDLLFVSPDVDLEAPNDDGTPYKILPDPWSVAENPLYPLYYRDKLAKRTSLIGNVIGTWNPFTWISVNAKYTYEFRSKYWNTYTPKGYLAGNGQTIGGSLYKSNYAEMNNNFQFTANLNKQFGDFTAKLKLSYLYESSSYNDYWVLGKDFVVTGVPQLGNTDPTKASMDSYEGKIVAINYFGILDADYKDKYLVSALFRYDASSLFGPNVRWNPYYRFSLGYRISEDVTINGIDELKVRASIGTSGQRPGFSYQYETYNVTNGNVIPGNLGNKDLRPSETTEIEIGLNVDFLSIFSFEGTYSQSVTDGAFALAPLPSHLGFPNQWQNVGTMGAKVWEASLNGRFFSAKHFSWNMNINFDRIRQKVISIDIPEYTTGPRHAFYIKSGETFGIMYGYDWVRTLDQMAKQLPEGKTIDDYEVNSDGYVVPKGSQSTTDELAIKVDLDGDGLGDKVQIGDGNPDFNLSLGNSFKIYNFDLYFLFSWKKGGDIYNYTRQYTFRDQRDLVFDQYGKPNSEKKTINYYNNFYDGTGINSYFIEDGSYVKLRELSLYYSLSRNQLKNLKLGFVKGFKIGVQSRNLLTFTKYKGYDPEVASGSDLTNYPVDNFGYPNYRVITGSLTLNF